jgi:glycosyltransferase involved in cell wall biosynthesis
MSSPLKKIKVCFSTIEYPPDMGGVSKSAGRITGFLRSAGFEIHVFVPGQNVGSESLFIKTEIDEITVYRVNCGVGIDSDEQFIKAIACVDQSVRFNIFHGFYLPKAYACIAVADRDRRPVIASFRGMDVSDMSGSAQLAKTKIILENAAWITSVSSENLRIASAIHDITAKSSFIFNSVQRSWPAPVWTCSPANEKIIGTVSTFRKKKNIPLLLDAYHRIPANFRRKLLLVGDFIDNKAVNHLRKRSFSNVVAYLGLEDEVTVTGFVKETKVYQWLQAMNVFVLSSYQEGLPNALLEALSIGLPVVSTAVDGVNDILVHEKNALLVPADDADLMGRSIAELLRHKSLASNLSKGALKLSKELSPEQEKEKWIALYRKLVR